MEKGSPSSPREFIFTEEDLTKFLNQPTKVKKLPGASTFQQSLQWAYEYLEEKKQKLEKKSNDYIAFLQAQSRLILDRKLTPVGQGRNALISELEKSLKSFIVANKARKDRQTRLLVNYAYIYRGKALRELGQFEKAYQVLLKVEPGYTKTTCLDIAEMILEKGFRPSNIGTQSVVKKLLADDPKEKVVRGSYEKQEAKERIPYELWRILTFYKVKSVNKD